MPRRLLALVTAVGTALLTALVASPVAASTYVPNPDDHPTNAFYSVPYAPTLYWSRPTPGGGYLLDVATYDDWKSQGFPAPRPVSVRYERAPWSSTIVAAPAFPGWGTTSETHGLTYHEWVSVGFPTPRVTWQPAGIYYRSYKNTPVINAFYGGTVHALTLDEWFASGSPRAYQENLAPGTEIRQWTTSPELFMVLDGRTHKLTASEWASYGYPAPTRWGVGFYKLTWDPTIARVWDAQGGAAVLTLADWAAQDYPSPLAQPTLPGDQYCYESARDVVRYDGVSFDGEMSGAVAVARLGVPVETMPVCPAG